MTWFNYARMGKSRAGLRSFLASLSLAFALIHSPAAAEVGEPAITPGAKGAVGTAMLGAELVLAVEAAIGVKPWWGYAIGGGVGAIGGTVGGIFIDKQGNAPLSSGLLVGGMLLAVPTAIAVLNATRYKPPKNPENDSGKAAEEAYHMAKFDPSPALVAVTPEGPFLRFPAIDVRPVYSDVESKIFAVKNAASMRVPVFSLSF